MSIFEYSGPLHPPLRPFIQYWGTLMRDKFPVLNTLPKLDIFPIKSLTLAIFSTKIVSVGRNGQKCQNFKISKNILVKTLLFLLNSQFVMIKYPYRFRNVSTGSEKYPY